MDTMQDIETHEAEERSRKRRRGLAAAVVVVGLAAAAPGIGTVAGFTAQDVNEDNTIESGTLDVAFGQDSRYFEVANMKPGDVVRSKVQVANTGSLTEDFVLDTANVAGSGQANLDDVLTIELLQDGQVVATGGRVSELEAATGTLGAGDDTTFEVVISWPENAPEVDNAYQASGVTFDLVVDATQLAGQEIGNGDNAGN